jgi:hypothetical protein
VTFFQCGVHMRRTTLLLATALCPAVARAQARDTTPDRHSLPRDVRREVVDKWNGGAALRATGRLEIEQGRDVHGSVAVQGGPLVLSGHVSGDVLALNADVVLRPTARIDGDLLVVGGAIEGSGRTSSYVGGEIRIYRQALGVRQEGDRIVVDRSSAAGEDDDSWWRRLERRRAENRSDLRIVQAGPYNRVEGLPVSLGPALYRRQPWGGIRLDAAAVVRTASSFASDAGDVGYDVRSELQIGHASGVGVGASAFSIVDAAEGWQLSDAEVALSSFVWHRDYRDYYGRHGVSAFVSLFGRRGVTVTGSYTDERWLQRVASDPFSLFDNDAAWRPNPALDDGHFRIANATGTLDTRSDAQDPWSGWLVTADLERGSGRIDAPGPRADGRTVAPGGAVSYTRGFLDLRRYNRLAPDAQLNMRIVMGGWLGGDPLPLERRLSVDGPGTLPGFRSRTPSGGVDVGGCGTDIVVPGQPALCDRIALVQLEYRGDLYFGILDRWRDVVRGRRGSSHGDAVWVLFADGGRGWYVNAPPGTPSFGSAALPPFSSFRTDFGVGLDFGVIGFYGAKSVSIPDEPAAFFVRLQHRF